MILIFLKLFLNESFKWILELRLFFKQQNKSLRKLNIGRNFNGLKVKIMKQVMEGLVELVQEEDSVS